MGIKETIHNLLNKDSRVKEILEENRAQRLAIQRDKNSNERELERFLEEKRQENIKLQLDKFRKEKNNDLWKSNLMSKDNMFKTERPILKEKNIFASAKNKSRGMR